MMRIIGLWLWLVALGGAAIQVPSTPPPTQVSLNANALGSLSFSQPVCIASRPGSTVELFICEKTGVIRRIPDVTVASPVSSQFLHVASMLSGRGEQIHSSSESGVLGLAFHPKFATDPQKNFCFVFYSALKNGTAYQRVARFEVVNNVAVPSSERILIDQLDDAGNHNGGDLHFGPDGYLYVSVGDEGGGDDNLQNSQRIDKDIHSAILRIDVDRKLGNLEPNNHPAIPLYSGTAAFSIPADNPFIHTTLGGDWNGMFNGANYSSSLPAIRTEFWAVGLRNPWRMSFDTATGELWVGDVGQGAREEIDIVTRGKNYGWFYREGRIARPGSGTPPAGFVAEDPVYDYTRGSGTFQGSSVTGGVVYHGSRISSLVGAYIFGDYGSGNIWALRRTPTLDVQRITGGSGIVAFGTDPSNGDVLVANINDGIIRRLVGTATGSYPNTLTATGLFTNVANLTPDPALLPYQVNVPFWSDFAEKRRWVHKPASANFAWSMDAPWALPNGMIWVKHFDLDLTRNDSSTRKRIETRVLVKNATGAYGVSYRWNDAGTEATLVADAGVSFPLNVIENGTPRVQTWRIPSRAQCMQCHTPQAGFALSFNTRQLNCDSAMFGATANQLSGLAANGWINNAVPAPNTLPRHVRANESAYSVEARVRSYFDVNCAQCHRPGGSGAPAQWDARAQTPLDLTGLVNVAAVNNGADPLNRLVVPGDPTHSIVLHRINAANGFSRMPPLGTNEPDLANAALVTAWFQQELPTQQTYDEWRVQQFGSNNSPDGAPTADPDGDGVTNQDEYLAGSSPLNGGSRPQMSVTQNDEQLTLQLPVPAHRAFQIDVTTDLQQWSPLNVPGNQGIPRDVDSIEFTVPITATPRFYRARYWKP